MINPVVFMNDNGDSSFNSTERLVEFGMSAAIATQMISTMNQVMETMKIPTATMPTAQPQLSYYVVVDNKNAGPMTLDELTQFVDKGMVKKDTFVWRTNSNGWTLAQNLPEVNKLLLLSKNSTNEG